MKEIEIDKYVGKIVTVIDCDGYNYLGKLYKVKDHFIIGRPQMDACAVKNGYYLETKHYNTCFCKSHIKKIIGGV